MHDITLLSNGLRIALDIKNKWFNGANFYINMLIKETSYIKYK